MTEIENKKEKFVPMIMEILETAIQGSIEMLTALYENNLEYTIQLQKDLTSVIQTVKTTNESIKEGMKHSYCEEMIENVEDTLEDTETNLTKKDFIQASHLIEFQLLPFLRITKEIFYFWGCIYPDKERMNQYYENEFARNYKCVYYEKGKKSKYKLSIVVSAYNHLATTKKCIDHVLKYTKFEEWNAELILIDHGSNDGTLEYFKTIDGAKVIHFKRNVRTILHNLMPMVCEGEYLNFISNDILVTRDWAWYLMECLESDEKIAIAVPSTPNISNMQMLYVPTQDPIGFVEWANSYNSSNSKLWNDRARLMPPIAMYRMSALNELSMVDPYFYSMEFLDDDFSLRARRKGYRQVLCRNVACFHFGSITLKSAQKKEGTLQYGRELFKIKHGVDAWGTGFCYDYNVVQSVNLYLQNVNEPSILGVDCGFGDTTLQVRNKLRENGKTCKLYHLTVQSQYAQDLKYESDYFELQSCSIVEAMSNTFEDKKFDIIYFARSIENYENVEGLIRVAKKRLSENGLLLFSIENPFHVLNIYSLLNFTLPDERTSFIQPDFVTKVIKNNFIEYKVINAKKEVEGIDVFVRKYFSNIKDKAREELTARLLVKKIYYLCEN